MNEINRLLKKLHKKKLKLRRECENNTCLLIAPYGMKYPQFNSELHTKYARVSALINELESLINIHKEAFNKTNQ